MHIKFKFGPTRGSSPTTLELGAMTVLVGPNGAGKTLALRELCTLIRMTRTYYFGAINDKAAASIASVNLGAPRQSLEAVLAERLKTAVEAEVHELFKLESMTHYSSSRSVEGLLGSASEHAQKWTEQDLFGANDHEVFPLFMAYIKGLPTASADAITEHLISSGLITRSYFLPVTSAHHHLESRLNVLADAAAHSLHKPPENPLMRLLMRRDLLDRVNTHVHEAFGFYLDIDATALTSLRAIITDERPWPQDGLPPLPVGQHNRYTTARPLVDQSSGVRLFISTIVQVIASECDIILIDEPETCLHPALARSLGAILTNLAEERGLSIIAATHSPDFLAGCVSAHHPVSIGRLEYRRGQGSAHALSPSDLDTMLASPLLRSTGMMSALFHRAAIVCEGPSDRVLYGEINDRLAHHEQDHPRLMRDCLFIDVNGKSAIPKVLGHLRATGIPIACIVDLDILLDTRLLERFLKELDVHEVAVKTLSQMRENVAAVFKSRDEVKMGGISNLTLRDASVVRMFIRSVAEHGIFVPENGTLEHWFPEFDVPRGERSKSEFVPAVFEKMGPIGTGLRPAPDDIWAFIRQIARYLDAYVPPPASPSS